MLQEAINDPRAFECFLREQGFSRARAKAITATGFKAADVDEKLMIEGLVNDLGTKKQCLIENKRRIFEKTFKIIKGKQEVFKSDAASGTLEIKANISKIHLHDMGPGELERLLICSVRYPVLSRNTRENKWRVSIESKENWRSNLFGYETSIRVTGSRRNIEEASEQGLKIPPIEITLRYKADPDAPLVLYGSLSVR